MISRTISLWLIPSLMLLAAPIWIAAPAAAQVSADSIPDLAAWWRAEGNGSDEFGGSPGLEVDGVGYQCAVYGEAFEFDGSTGYIDIEPGANLVLGENDFTIMAWVKLNAGATGQQEIFHRVEGSLIDNSAKSAFLEYSTATNQLRFAIGQDGALQNDLQTAAPLNPDQWHHIVAIRDGNTNSLYLDGQFLDSKTAGSNVNAGMNTTLGTPPADARIGAHTPNGVPVNRFFDGQIDEVALYSRALTLGEVRSLATGKHFAIARAGDPAPDRFDGTPCTGCGNFVNLGAPSMTNQGEFSFSATLDGANVQGIFCKSLVTATTIAVDGDAAPTISGGTLGTFTGFLFGSESPINEDHDVIFAAQTTSGPGLFIYENGNPGTLKAIGRSGDPVLPSLGSYSGMGSGTDVIRANAQNQVAFVADITPAGNNGIYVDEPDTTFGEQIVPLGISPGGTLGNFTEFGPPAIADRITGEDVGDLVFAAALSPGAVGSGIFFYDASSSSLLDVALEGSASPLLGCDYGTFPTAPADSPAFNQNGAIVFTAPLTGCAISEAHILADSPSGPFTVIAAETDKAPGNESQRFSAPFPSGAALNDGIDIAYEAEFSGSCPGDGLFLDPGQPDVYPGPVAVALPEAPAPDGTGKYVSFGSVRPDINTSRMNTSGVTLPGEAGFHATATLIPGSGEGLFLPEPGAFTSLIAGGTTLTLLARRRRSRRTQGGNI